METKEYEILYKRSKTGKIVYWSIRVIPRFNNGNGGYSINKETGQLGTESPVEHDELITVGKQKRSAEEQAHFMALSDWKKKKDEGYKTLRESMGDNPTAEDAIDFGFGNVQILLERNLPASNTDAAGNVKPMLAHDVEKKKHTIKYPVFIQPKLDGVRCLAHVYDDGVKLYSRQGKEFAGMQHIKSDLMAFPNGIYDGELYTQDLTFQEIVSAVKAEKENSKKVQYHIYDIITPQPYKDRFIELLSVFDKVEQPSSLKIVQTNTVDKWEMVINFHNVWVKHGYEGAILRDPNAYYEHARSNGLLKVKQFDEEEFDFVEWIQGQRDEDLIAVLLTNTRKGGERDEFRAKMMGTVEQKELMKVTKPSKITTKFFGLTTDGIPRFPIGKSIRDYE